MVQEELKNVILKAQCCISDMAYKALTKEMFLKSDSKIMFNNVKFAQALVQCLNRYYDVLYNYDDETCLTEKQIDTIIQKLNSLCDNCGCCTDKNDILKDI